MPVPGKNDVAADGERRKAERHRPADSLHMALICEGRNYDCYLEDMSLDGLGLRVEAEVPLGEIMILRHSAAGDFRLKRVWVEAERLGVRFQNPGPKLEHTLRCIQLVLDARDSQSKIDKISDSRKY